MQEELRRDYTTAAPSHAARVRPGMAKSGGNDQGKIVNHENCRSRRPVPIYREAGILLDEVVAAPILRLSPMT